MAIVPIIDPILRDWTTKFDPGVLHADDLYVDPALGDTSVADGTSVNARIAEMPATRHALFEDDASGLLKPVRLTQELDVVIDNTGGAGLYRIDRVYVTIDGQVNVQQGVESATIANHNLATSTWNPSGIPVLDDSLGMCVALADVNVGGAQQVRFRDHRCLCDPVGTGGVLSLLAIVGSATNFMGTKMQVRNGSQYSVAFATSSGSFVPDSPAVASLFWKWGRARRAAASVGAEFSNADAANAHIGVQFDLATVTSATVLMSRSAVAGEVCRNGRVFAVPAIAQTADVLHNARLEYAYGGAGNATFFFREIILMPGSPA